ncbi:MAG: hypothetical protein LBM41_02345 [Ruminococcus sp.]|jgi:hypothetical protein|nr:hypothetical protein [Ruminococcus sp.]
MLDYNILYEVPDVIDFYVLSVGQNRYIYKGMSDVHDINIARKFTNISAAHRYARQCGRTDYRIIGVKNYNDEERSIQKLFFIKHRKKRTDEDLREEIMNEEYNKN